MVVRAPVGVVVQARCPKFHILKHNYSICAGQRGCEFCDFSAFRVNPLILDICPLRGRGIARIMARIGAVSRWMRWLVRGSAE